MPKWRPDCGRKVIWLESEVQANIDAEARSLPKMVASMGRRSGSRKKGKREP
jgi:hypothetical protein